MSKILSVPYRTGRSQRRDRADAANVYFVSLENCFFALQNERKRGKDSRNGRKAAESKNALARTGFWFQKYHRAAKNSPRDPSRDHFIFAFRAVTNVPSFFCAMLLMRVVSMPGRAKMPASPIPA